MAAGFWSSFDMLLADVGAVSAYGVVDAPTPAVVVSSSTAGILTPREKERRRKKRSFSRFQVVSKAFQMMKAARPWLLGLAVPLLRQDACKKKLRQETQRGMEAIAEDSTLHVTTVCLWRCRSIATANSLSFQEHYYMASTRKVHILAEKQKSVKRAVCTNGIRGPGTHAGFTRECVDWGHYLTAHNISHFSRAQHRNGGIIKIAARTGQILGPPTRAILSLTAVE